MVSCSIVSPVHGKLLWILCLHSEMLVCWSKPLDLGYITYFQSQIKLSQGEKLGLSQAAPFNISMTYLFEVNEKSVERILLIAIYL